MENLRKGQNSGKNRENKRMDKIKKTNTCNKKKKSEMQQKQTVFCRVMTKTFKYKSKI
jgi:hypothetical protein